MKLITLIENLVYQKDLVAEHGLSIYIDSGDVKILFDTGQSENFASNAQKLGIDIASVDYLVLSHGHYDHSGGLARFLDMNRKAKIVLKQEALLPKYHGNHYVGMQKDLQIPEDRLEYINMPLEISKGIFVFPEIQNFYAIDRHKNGFLTVKNNVKKKDDFNDELFLCILQKNKLNIISSCSHNGITNCTETARQFFQIPVNLILGGFHTTEKNEKIADHIVNYFNKNNVKKLGICHCTGVENYPLFKNRCNANVFYNSTGKYVEL